MAYALVAAVSVAVAIWGFRWLVRCTTIICIVGGLLAVLMLVAFAGSISWGYEGSQPLLGDFWPTWFLVATTIGVSGALLVCTILGDWTRYISSERHSQSRLAWIGSLGIFIGFVVPAAIGAAVTTAFTDPAAPFTVGVANDSPLWYAVLLLPFGVFGGVGLVAQSLYSAGLDLEAVVVRLTRARATVIIGVIGVVLVYLGLLAPTVQAAATAAFIVFAELARRGRRSSGSGSCSPAATTTPTTCRCSTAVAPAAGTGTPGAGAGRPRWRGPSGRSSGC